MTQRNLEAVKRQLERTDRGDRYDASTVTVLYSGEAEVIKRTPHKNRREFATKKPLYRMSPEMMGEELAQAQNCLMDLDAVPDKIKIATRFLKLLLKTHNHVALHELLMAVEDLIDTSTK